jgi:hypothetical protein
METAITAVIVIMVLLFAVFTSAENYFSAQDAVLESWQEMEQRMEDHARTDLSAIGAVTDGNVVTLTLRNDGSTKLADYDQWDVLLDYTGPSTDHVVWHEYVTGTLSAGEWTVHDWYLDASAETAEVFDPQILNPGEEMVIEISVSYTISTSSTSLATVATPNGIVATMAFTR